MQQGVNLRVACNLGHLKLITICDRINFCADCQRYSIQETDQSHQHRKCFHPLQVGCHKISISYSSKYHLFSVIWWTSLTCTRTALRARWSAQNLGLRTWQKYFFVDDNDAELFADDDDAELLLQDAWRQPQQVLCLQGRDKIKLLKDLSLKFDWRQG